MNRKIFVTIAIAGVVAAILLGLSRAAEMNASDLTSPLAEVKQAIDAGNHQWSEGWARGDAVMVANIFAEDGVQLKANGIILRGREQIRMCQQAAMQGVDPRVKVTVTTLSVWLDKDTAYETGKYKYEYTEKGKPGVEEGRYVTIWKRQKDDSWKLSMDMGVPQG